MLKVKRLDPQAILPTVAHPGEDLAYDLYALEETVLKPGVQTKVRTGIAAFEEKRELDLITFPTVGSFDIPTTQTIQVGKGFKYGLLIRDRSSMAAKGITVSGGVIDAGYRGELVVILTASKPRKVWPGDKIAQMIPIPVLTSDVVEVDDLGESSRGEKGFGSSGR